MKSNFFEKIAELLTGVPAAERHSGAKTNDAPKKTVDSDADRQVKLQPEADKTQKNRVENALHGTNAIDKKSNLINAVVANLSANYRGDSVEMNGMVLDIFVNDNTFFNALTLDKNFKDELTEKIYTQLGMVFSDICVRSAFPQQEVAATQLFAEVKIAIRSAQRLTQSARAMIVPVAECGSTIKSEYRLDAQELRSIAGGRYNIGIFEEPRLNNGIPRHNHIAINPDPESPDFEKNKYVSRAHANITYNDKFGFMLNVEDGGTRMGGKRTHIIRLGSMIEVDNPLTPMPLYDGDYIVLSKNVYLLFKTL